MHDFTPLSPQLLCAKIETFLDALTSYSNSSDSERHRLNLDVVSGLRAHPITIDELVARSRAKELHALGHALRILADASYDSGRVGESVDLYFGAHELFRAANSSPQPNLQMNRTLETTLKALVDELTPSIAERTLNAVEVQKYVQDAIKTAWGSIDSQIEVELNGVILETLEMIRQQKRDDEEFNQFLVRRNAATILALDLPLRVEPIRGQWRELALQWAPTAARQAELIAPRAQTSIAGLLPTDVRERLTEACHASDLDLLADTLAGVESAFIHNLRLRLTARSEYLPPASKLRHDLEAPFEAARRRLQLADRQAIADFESLQRRSRNNTIAIEWLAYAHICFEERRVHRNIKLLEDCINNPNFRGSHQWVARWNLACALRGQRTRAHEAVAVLMPVLDEATYHPSDVLDLCLLWAMEDGDDAVLPSLWLRSRYFEAHLLAALHAFRTAPEHSTSEISEHINRVEKILWEDTEFPRPDERLGLSELDDVAARFKDSALYEAGLEWFGARMYPSTERTFFKNLQCLGQLYEAAGHPKQAWDAYVEEFSKTIRARAATSATKKQSFLRIVRFAQGAGGELARNGQNFVQLHYANLGLSEHERDRLIGGFVLGSATQFDRPGSEESHPPRKDTVGGRAGAPPISRPPTDFAMVQAIIDQKAKVISQVRRFRDMADYADDGHKLVEAVKLKHSDFPSTVEAAALSFLGSAGALAEGVTEEQARTILVDVQSRLPQIVAAAEQYRDLREFAQACKVGVYDLEMQLGQTTALKIRVPSSLGVDISPPDQEHSYATRILFGLENPYEVDVKLVTVAITSSADRLDLNAEPMHFSESESVLGSHSSRIIEFPVKIKEGHGAEISLTILVSYLLGGIRRSKKDSDRVIVTAERQRIPVELRYSTSVPVPVDRPDLFHGREENLADLEHAFEGGRLRRLPFVTGIRRVGKTTLLQHFAHRMPYDAVPIIVRLDEIIDAFGEIPKIPTAGFIRELMATAVEQVKLQCDPITLAPLRKEEFTDEPAWRLFDEWLEELRKQSGRQRLLLCIDEMQTVVQCFARDQLDDGFLTWLRGKVRVEAESPLVVCTGSEPYGKMRMRYEQHNLWGHVAQYPISFVKKSAMVNIATRPVAQDGVRWLPDAMEALWDMTEGHPWITQSICDRVMRTLNGERRRVVSPQDVERATRNLVTDDPTAVKLWWNEGQELVTAEMVGVAFLVIEMQGAPRDSVSEPELIQDGVRRGMVNIGNIIDEMVDLELLAKDVSAGLISIKSRFLESFLQDLHRRNISEVPTKPHVALMLDWENVKRGLLKPLMGRPDAPILAARCETSRLARTLLAKAQEHGECPPYARQAVAHFEEPDFRGDRTVLENENFIPRGIDDSGTVKADRADHRLREQVRDVLEHHKSIRVYVLGTGDGDFSETVRTLLDRGKKVVLLAAANDVSRFYVTLQSHHNFSVEYLHKIVFGQTGSEL